MFKKLNKKEKSDPWNGKYFDLWSVVHFLSGIVFAFILIYFGFKIVESLIIVILAGLLWEIFEFSFKMKEKKMNRMTDILFMVVGFKLFFNFLPRFFEKTYEISFFCLFSIVVSIFIIMTFLGWKAYRRRI